MFRNFIHRPVLAIVISVLILFVGGLAMQQLPTSQFPEIAPTTVKPCHTWWYPNERGHGSGRFSSSTGKPIV